MAQYEADVVIVGAGAAGCVLAGRLSEDAGLKVLVLEAGGPDRNIWIRVPGGVKKAIDNPRLGWGMSTEPMAAMNNRRISVPRGRVLGGTASMNGMTYIRGTPPDYDLWRDSGNEGWGWNDVLPYFRRAEGNVRGADKLHGDSGPLKVSDNVQDEINDAFIQAASEAGYPRNDDFNGPSQEGAGYYQKMIRDGRRACGADAYLHPAMKRPNLQVLTSAQATRVVFDGRRATGVEFRRGGQTHTVTAKREVIVAGGAFHSPHLLQLSGLGPAELLQRHGVPLIADMPGVGANLQDHMQVRLLCRCTQPVTVNDILASPLRLAGEVARYALFHKGMLATGLFRTGLFACSSAAPAGWPDLQVFFTAIGYNSINDPPLPFSSFTIAVSELRPTSRGRVEIGSNDPLALPKIDPNFLGTEADCVAMIDGFRLGRKLIGQPTLARYMAEELMPGPDCQSDEQVLDYVRRIGGTGHHPVGTCSMGPNGQAVVDARLRVHGIGGLRVVDGSIMPYLISGNTNAPIIMIAEKASDMIREELRG